MKILHLTLFRQWFDAIAASEKTEEYRRITPYWTKRLVDREYDEVHFRNGYAKFAPFMRVKFRGVKTSEWQSAPVYAIQLGEILEVRNYEKDGTPIHSSETNRDAQAEPAIPDAEANGKPQGVH